MAFRRRGSYRSRSNFRRSGRRNFSSRGMRRRAPARRRATGRRASRPQTIRIVIEQPGAAVAQTLLGQKVAPGPKVARF